MPSLPFRRTGALPILRAAVGAVGWLLLVSLGALAAGALTQHDSSLPANYTWTVPYEILLSIVRRRHFPVILLLVYLTGRLARRGDWDAGTVLQRLTAELTLAAKLALLRRLAGAIALLLAGTHVLNLRSSIFFDTLDFDARLILDQAALFALGWQLGGWTPRPRALVVHVGQAVVVVFAFSTISYYYTVIKALVLLSGAPVDSGILALERALFGAHPHQWITSWFVAHPDLLARLDDVYFRLFEHMLLTTVLLIGLRLPRERVEYIGALVVCYLFGGPLYHLAPAMGPLYWSPQEYAHLASHAMKTTRISASLLRNLEELRHGTATTLDSWAYIACLPSLHVAHEVVMLWYARHSRIALLASLLFCLATILAVMALGWHYFLDVVAGALLAGGAIALVHWQRDRLMPACLRDEPGSRPSRSRPGLC